MEGILVEENKVKDEKEKKKLEEEGYKVVKVKQNQNIIKVFEEDKTIFSCDKDEIIFRVSLFNSTLCRIIITEKITTVVIFSSKRVQTFTFRIQRDTSLRGLRKNYIKAKSYQEFATSYIQFLKENNDDTVIEWLKEFMKKKENEEKKRY
ncbi:hypothetical protein EWF20_12015 [Sulfolobus sp. S-194]|uniref:hypothetical protein n=1 Tax=Sulfolobus sp. S-194 TaxID=2512240 RepID=UPI001436D18F|nr:hypothetical protein [Sulfolobus sp. S-194]QIW24778.1 hypothetical protein EWF20_12015 [Sulfolobus sp. S-194]